jgi:glucans biosynthesis protein
MVDLERAFAMRRREVLLSTAAFWVVSSRAAVAAEAEGPSPFSHETVRREAARLAAEPFSAEDAFTVEAVPEMDYPAYVGIRYRPEAALWVDADLPFRVRFFHPGLYFRQPVDIHVVRDGEARLLPFDPEVFEFDDPELRDRMGRELGYVGFNLLYAANWDRDVASFLGASYFRAVGASMQFGKSARGIAVDTTRFGSEEFPAFRSFWLERPSPDVAEMVVHALLDGPSLTGAYRFVIRPGQTTEMDVEATLFPRRDIDDAGLAPITSMYLVGENDQLRGRSIARPEAHDSDGLFLWRGNGEWVWRPLANPDQPRISVFADENPRGFGLLQRDREFGHYRDVGADYEERPNLWVEPLGDWGAGAVLLVELPTDDEVFDNIVTYWRPDAPLPAGGEVTLRYRLHWGSAMPTRLQRPAEVAATFKGAGGRPGSRNDATKFMIEFDGGTLPMLDPEGAPPEASVTASRGEVNVLEVLPLPESGRWRLEFDLVADGTETVNLRAYLRLGPSALTETWLYRFEPGAG